MRMSSTNGVASDLVIVDQQVDEFVQLFDGDDSLTGQSDIKIRMMGGDDYLEITGGMDNYANGNLGDDFIVLRKGRGEYLGGEDSDTIEVFAADAGTLVNGNMGEDFITGIGNIVYRGGKDDDVIAVSQGEAYGDKGADTFVGVKGEGYAVIQDYIIGEDLVEIEMDGSWSSVDSGLMFTTDLGDQIMLLVGIDDEELLTMV